MKVGIEGPEEFQGNMMGLVNQRRGMLTGSESLGNFCSIEAEVPLSEMFGFSTELRSATQGKAGVFYGIWKICSCSTKCSRRSYEAYRKKQESKSKLESSIYVCALSDKTI